MSATSDEQRAAFEAAASADQKEFLLSGHKTPDWILARADGFAAGWQACAAQQAPQERANRALLQRCRYEIASLHDIYHDEMTYVPKALARLIQDIDAALAANPQQNNGAVEKPTKEPDAAIGASQVPEGVANAERSAMQLCPTHDPQQSNDRIQREHVPQHAVEQSQGRAFTEARGAEAKTSATPSTVDVTSRERPAPNPQQIASETKENET